MINLSCLSYTYNPENDEYTVILNNKDLLTKVTRKQIEEFPNSRLVEWLLKQRVKDT